MVYYILFDDYSDIIAIHIIFTYMKMHFGGLNLQPYEKYLGEASVSMALQHPQIIGKVNSKIFSVLYHSGKL